jgi:hypothetical protein
MNDRRIVERLREWPLSEKLALEAAAHIEALEAALRTDDANLRLLVDIVWQHATESTAVPFYKTSDMLIAKYRAAFAPVPEIGSEIILTGDFTITQERGK